MEGKNVDIIYLNFSNTFDMISYYLLVKIKTWIILKKKK